MSTRAAAVPARAGLFLPALVTVFALLLAGFWTARRQLARGSHVESGSSYRSAADGTRALYLLLQRLGYRVHRLQRAPFLDDPSEQLVSIGREEPHETPRRAAAEAEALARFVARGGRLIYFSGVPPRDIIAAVCGGRVRRPSGKKEPLRREPIGLSSEDRPLDVASLPRLKLRDADGREVTARQLSFFPDLPRGSRPVLSAGRRRAAFAVSRGNGEAIFIATLDPVENRNLEDADNLEFALSLIDARRPVLFDEYRHGFDEEEGLPGLAARYGLRFLPLQLCLLLAVLALRSVGASDGTPKGPVESVRQGARQDFVAAAASLCARSVPESEAVTSFLESALHRLSDPRFSVRRTVVAREKLAALRTHRLSLVEVHREILRIEKELEET